MNSKTILLLLVFLFSISCDTKYEIGSAGEAGGIVFYDSGEYGTKGWRYLEVASPGWNGKEEDPFVGWGWSGGQLVGDTKMSIGSGYENTMKIISELREVKTAADIVTEYSIKNRGNTFADWYLPSREELGLVHKNLGQRGIGDFRNYDSYWSSSEYNMGAAWMVDFSDGTSGYYHKAGIGAIRPIRSF